MTAEQSLAGAMGCAAWRARGRLREHAALAPHGGVVTGGSTSAPSTGVPDVLSLNEVGVTDAVMATLWRFGPREAAYAVSQGAESNHLGADIAVMHRSTRRILLYQAKLGRLDGSRLKLKSKVTTSQGRLLRRPKVTVNGKDWDVTGRIAIYQADTAPFLARCDHHLEFEWWHLWAPWSGSGAYAHDPTVGRWYYENVLHRCGCSSSGILAAAAPRTATTALEAKCTWPWEFDVHHWLGDGSPIDDADASVGDRIPDFEPYMPTDGEPDELGDNGELATELARSLGLSPRYRLYLIQV